MVCARLDCPTNDRRLRLAAILAADAVATR